MAQAILGPIGDLIERVLTHIFLFIDTFVYWLVNLAYQTFLAISQIRIFSNQDLNDLSQRIYIIIGVVALFLVAYALLLAIINPDSNNKEHSLGKVVPNIALAIIGIAIVPSAFNVMYDVQHAILCGNVIPKLILGNSYSDGFDVNSEEPNQIGAQMATLLFKSFFYPLDENGEPVDISQTGGAASHIYENDCDGADCKTLEQAYAEIEAGAPFSALRKFSDAVVDEEIGYVFIISTIAGGFCVYVLASLCLDMALRAVKLSYLQVIAPLPILTIIIPGQKKVFSNWLKKTISCFIEVFTRLFVVVFVAYIMRTLDSVYDTFFGTGGVYCGEIGGVVFLLVKAATIVGLFWFIKTAPKFVSEVTGLDSKGFKLGVKDKLAESGMFQAMGAMGAATTGAVQNALNKEGSKFSKGLSTLAGAGSGLARGFAANKGSKNYHDLASNTSRAANDVASARIKREYYRNTHGGNLSGVVKGHVGDIGTSIDEWAHGSGKSSQNAKADILDKIKKYMDAINDAADKNDGIKALNATYEGEISRIKESRTYSQDDINNANSKLKNLQSQMDNIRNSVTMSDSEKAARLNPLLDEENKLKLELDQMSKNTIDAKQDRIKNLQKEWDSRKSAKRAEVIKDLVAKGDVAMKHNLENYAQSIAANRSLVAYALQKTMSGSDFAQIEDLVSDKGIDSLVKMIENGQGFDGADVVSTAAKKISSSAGKMATSLRFEQVKKDANKK